MPHDFLEWIWQSSRKVVARCSGADEQQPRSIVDFRPNEGRKVRCTALEVVEVGIAYNEQRAPWLRKWTAPSVKSGSDLSTDGLLEEQGPDWVRLEERDAFLAVPTFVLNLVGESRLNHVIQFFDPCFFARD